MGLKRDELANPNSCLNKAADNEPIFVLRAQDVFSPILVKAWIELAKGAGEISSAKLNEAELSAGAMQGWHGRKVPD